MPALADIQDGRFGAAQVFDVQRSPAFPVAGSNFTLSNFQQPYGNGQDQVGQYSIGSTQYIQFIDTDASAACSYEINLYESDGTFVSRITSGGDIYGLGDEGFLHVSVPGGYGTFVSSGTGYSFGDSLTYVPDTAQATCPELDAYTPSTTPTAVPGPISVDTAATPVPVLPMWGIFGLVGLLVLAMRRDQ